MIENTLAELALSGRKDVGKEELKDTREFIREAIEDNRLKFLWKDDRQIGFYTWCEMFKNGEQFIHVNNLYILPEERNASSLLEIKTFLRGKYPDAKGGYWMNTKRNEWRYR